MLTIKSLFQSQYVFIHDTLLDYIECGVTVIPVDDLEEILDEQYFTELGKIGLGKINDEWKVCFLIEYILTYR